MAESIKGPTAGTAKKRGRPSKAEIAERKRRELEAQRQADAGNPLGDNPKPAAAPDTADGKVVSLKPKAAAAPKATGPSAPAFGANRITEGPFLQHVRKLREQLSKIEEAKAVVKAKRGELKDLRNLAKADGIVLGELDEALEALETERVDLLAREERRLLYFEFLGLPTMRTAETAKIEKDPAQRWNRMGNVAGRLGEKRDIPEGCPPEHVQDWLHGYDRGQVALMKESPLTKDAFAGGADPTTGKAADAAGPGAAPETPPEGAPDTAATNDGGAIAVLGEHRFAAGTALEDANKKTLLAEHLDLWNASERIVALFGGKKRVLKEPDATLPSGFYEDTGEADAEVTDAEEAEPELAAALEAETGQEEALIEEVVEVVEGTEAASDEKPADEDAAAFS